MKTFLSSILFVLLSVNSFAQEVEMATGLRSSGKIYVVVAVIAVIFLGLIAYLFSIDKRLKKLEQKD